MKYSNYSTVIIGSGASGLYLALKLEEQKMTRDGVLIITKSTLEDSNTYYAQGGMVSVMEENKRDSVSLHVSDTIKAGAGLCDFNAVSFVSQNSSIVAKDLMEKGVEFDRDLNNNLLFGLEAAHSVPRILHAGGDSTGRVIEETLCRNVKNNSNIDIYENTIAVELLIDKNGVCRGVLTYNEQLNEYEAIYSNAVVIATGGIGQLYKHTTNPDVTTGDGIALAKMAGAELENMEFVQFHPTALSIPDSLNQPLVSEAVRGEGATLLTSDNERFMTQVDSRNELAPRDIVAKAIFDKLSERNEECVYLDISSIGLEKFKNRFPTITSICEKHNLTLDSMKIPVSPAAHYFMGGIKVNLDCETSIPNLYAIGEASSTGLHGANRLASNSLLECVVCAWGLSFNLSDKNLDTPKTIDTKIKEIIDLYTKDFDYDFVDTRELIHSLKDTMWNNVGIIRSEKSLNEARLDIFRIEKAFSNKHKCSNREEYELRNMIETAKSIIEAALLRRESIGAHKRSDFADIQQINKGVLTRENRADDTIFAK